MTSSQMASIFVKLGAAVSLGLSCLVAKGQNTNENYCASAYNIAPTIEACPDNQNFSMAADLCVERFIQEVEEVTRKLSGNFTSNQKTSVAAQNSKQQNNNINLSQTDRELRALLAHARIIRKDLNEYLTTIILPGNPGLDILMMYNVYDLLAEDNCYRDNRIKLEGHIAWIDRKIAELEQVDGKTLALDSATLERLGNLGAINSSSGAAKPAARTYGNGTGKVPAGRSPRPASTITGEVKDDKLK